jgi:hypothetical protein
MANQAQPQPQAVNVQAQAGYQQIGDQIFVTLDLGCGSMAMKIVIPVDGARHLAKMIAGAAETAATTIVKPSSLVAPN